MKNNLFIYNTLTRKKEEFKPLNPKHVGLYVCGPTVYGDPHLGHTRPAITFDILFRYLKHSDYKVRYVRNITDVGHLESDGDTGEDKIAKKARLEELEPMEVVQYYTDRYHSYMDQLNVQKPSIEPRASGHIIEQLQIVEDILAKGLAYESNGSVYFDVEAYNKDHHYGELSGRNIEDLLSTTRELDGQSEKRNSFDFALWKKAAPEHIMRWPSRFSEGFPGWHLECSAMSARYLGTEFDIHGGGMDLLFPHHECEIAQSTVCNGHTPAHYWMHNNMITIDGQKMGKSLGNFITLEQMFSGEHEKLEQAYSPMTVRFFIMQAHYRSTLDFSNEALQASQKGLDRLLEAFGKLDQLTASDASTFSVQELKDKCYAALDDDINTPILIAHLFDAVKNINSMLAEKATLTSSDLSELKALMQNMVVDILGLSAAESNSSEGNDELLSETINLLLNLRIDAKANKDWGTADKIRNELQALGVEIKDTKDGFDWSIK
ncbi:cysteine--tRNA ligase [Carboxylicivirga sp. M1479]|uniref:cysteine--tRNA ligase n=1 Tax=Carboxylicivirga sp. M1479 TaxID=2594476 RepID=UPI0011788104|nr:cysteine--tRNA ligase [Carboxylicivirga sp. M1479]TRX62357.1 cysteine--tRNA ligase [Carboxylicivirga sp. M1479]